MTTTVSSPPETPAPTAESSQPAQGSYAAEQCERDLNTLLTKTDRSYLEARRRLEDHPLVAAPAIIARLQGVPPPGPAARGRLLAVLGQFRRPEDLQVFATQLRRTALDPQAKPEDLVPWRALLREQGAAALPVLTALVGDRKLDEPIRGLLLSDLVEVYPVEQIGGLLALVGRGSQNLRRTLHLALRKRAASRAQERAALLAGVDHELTTDDPARLASLIRLRSALTPRQDPTFRQKLVALAPAAASGGPEFVIQVVAIRGLATLAPTDPEAEGHLEKIAHTHLAANRRNIQASEILGWLALKGLGESAAQRVADALNLTGAAQPRVATEAFRVATLHGDDWLEISQQHPWPQVRAAAIGRVLPPCTSGHVSKLAGIAGLRKGDDDGTVGRAAILALGRCRDDSARRQLTKLLHNDQLDDGRRAAAGWQLVKQFGNGGADQVAKALDKTPDIATARRLIQVLGRGGLATPAVVESLCDTVDITEMAADARAALVRIGASPTCE